MNDNSCKHGYTDCDICKLRLDWKHNNNYWCCETLLTQKTDLLKVSNMIKFYIDRLKVYYITFSRCETGDSFILDIPWSKTYDKNQPLIEVLKDIEEWYFSEGQMLELEALNE